MCEPCESPRVPGDFSARLRAWLVKLVTSKTAWAAFGTGVAILLQQPDHWPAAVASVMAALAAVSTGDKPTGASGPATPADPTALYSDGQ